jgi:hypothetical protein
MSARPDTYGSYTKDRRSHVSEPRMERPTTIEDGVACYVITTTMRVVVVQFRHSAAGEIISEICSRRAHRVYMHGLDIYIDIVVPVQSCKMPTRRARCVTGACIFILF